MMKFASEKAMALVDGQLAPAEAPAVIQEIAHTPALMRLVQKYLAVNPWKIRQLYRDLEQAPVPDRLTEGYGPNAKALLGLLAEGISLVVTVDCGTTAHEPVTL